MGKGAWQATVHGILKCGTRLSTHACKLPSGRRAATGKAAAQEAAATEVEQQGAPGQSSV